MFKIVPVPHQSTAMRVGFYSLHPTSSGIILGVDWVRQMDQNNSAALACQVTNTCTETVRTHRFARPCLKLFSLLRLKQLGPTTGRCAACGPPQRFQWLAEAFRKYLQILNLLKSVWGYICLIELLALDKVYLHKNNEYYLLSVPFCFIYLFYDQIRRYSPPLSLRWGTCLDNQCFFGALAFIVLKSTSGAVNPVPPNKSICPPNAAFSKWPSSQINCPSLQ